MQEVLHLNSSSVLLRLVLNLAPYKVESTSVERVLYRLKTSSAKFHERVTSACCLFEGNLATYPKQTTTFGSWIVQHYEHIITNVDDILVVLQKSYGNY